MVESHHQGPEKVSTYGQCAYSSYLELGLPKSCDLHPRLSQFPAVLVAMLVSTIPVSILGAHFSMDVTFWTPEQYRS